jgi:hypothetical protein
VVDQPGAALAGARVTIGALDGELAAALARLQAVLGGRGAWSVRAWRTTSARAGLAAAEVGVCDGGRLELTWFDDGARGRGVGVASVGLRELAPAALVDEARARARQCPGAPWQSPPAAGPARVRLADPDLRDGAEALAAQVTEGARQLAAGRDALGGGALVVTRTHHAAQSSAGLRLGWQATLAEATVELVGARGPVRMRARRLADVLAPTWLDAVIADAAAEASARDLVAGRYEVVLRAEAAAGARVVSDRAQAAGAVELDGGPDDLGWWELLVSQADAARARTGLVAYAVGDEIAPGAATAPEPLSVRSDGARDFGLRSAPLGADGAAVRRFALVAGGRAAGLGLDAHEAMQRGLEPNGGVRDLVVGPGVSAAADLGRHGAPRLEIVRGRWLELDVGSGHAVLAIELARQHDGAGARVVRGGFVRGDGLAWLAHARRSREVGTVGAVHGPIAYGLGELEIVGG